MISAQSKAFISPVGRRSRGRDAGLDFASQPFTMSNHLVEILFHSGRGSVCPERSGLRRRCPIYVAGCCSDDQQSESCSKWPAFIFQISLHFGSESEGSVRLIAAEGPRPEEATHTRASRLRENTGGLHTGKTGRRGQGEEIGRGSRKLGPIFEFPNSRCGRAPGNLDVSSHRILSRRMPGIWSRQSVCAVAYGERNALAATTSEPPGVDQFGHKLAGKCDRDPGTRVAGEREQQDQEVI
jgi:hypothetical protein